MPAWIADSGKYFPETYRQMTKKNIGGLYAGLLLNGIINALVKAKLIKLKKVSFQKAWPHLLIKARGNSEQAACWARAALTTDEVYTQLLNLVPIGHH